MQKWVVRDKRGREIYITEERWEHIVSGHSELNGHLEDVLNTIRYGQRQQQVADPSTYVYRRRCKSLRKPYNGILVVVTFRLPKNSNGATQSNNFVVTAWGIIMRK